MVRSGSGYLLEADGAIVDLIQFQDERGRGRALLARQPAAAAQHLERALGLWHGVMLDGLSHGPVLTGRCAIVEQDRLAAVDSLAELHLALGDPVRAGPLLQLQVLAEPLREQSYSLLMRARYQTDGVAAALQAYEVIRGALADQLGVEPGWELQRLHRAVLNRDSTLDPIRPAATPAGGVESMP
jgi:DNA-binding SARP family transcriptional activator